MLTRHVDVTPFSNYSAQARTTSHSWDSADEHAFTQMLERELDKIHDFQKAKVRGEFSSSVPETHDPIRRHHLPTFDPKQSLTRLPSSLAASRMLNAKSGGS